MEVYDVKLEDIKVGQRFRGEFGDLDDFAKNIKAKGLLQPITLDRELNLVAGERRLRACRKAKLETIPAIIRDVEDEADAREIELFENLHRKEMTWTERVNLEKRIHDLKKAEAKANGKPWTQKNTAAVLGKSEAAVSQTIGLAEAMQVLPALQKCGSEKEARKQYRKVVENVLVVEALSKESSKTYKYVKWADKHYKIGDAIAAMKKMRTGSIDFAEVDPPYSIDLQGKKSGKSAGIEHYNEIKPEDYPAFLAATAKQVFRILNPDRFCVWWFGIEWYQTVLETLREAGFNVDTIPAIWNKVDSGGTTNAPQLNLARNYEPFFIARKGVPDLRARGRSNVFSFKPVAPTAKTHPTERPVPLIREILDTFIYPGATVIVPFLGSGNTILAAYAGKSYAFGWDLSEEYKKGFLAKVNSMFEEELTELEKGSVK